MKCIKKILCYIKIKLFLSKYTSSINKLNLVNPEDIKPIMILPIGTICFNDS